jgi:hypothetical protein
MVKRFVHARSGSTLKFSLRPIVRDSAMIKFNTHEVVFF